MFLDDMEFGFEPKRNEMLKPTVHGIAPLIIAAGISAVAGIAGALADGGGPETRDPEILPSTVSGNIVQDMNFLFDLEAGEAMKGLTEQMNQWSGQDREFFENTFQPFQASLIEANQALIPGIVANAGAAMQSSLKDLMGGDFLKDAFRQQVEQSGGDISALSESFTQQIDNIPSAEQRIGEAISGVEQRFGAAGAELKRQMASQGLDVSQASKRQLAIEKAKAKAGAVGVAGEAARTEKLSATQAGIGVAANVQTGAANLLATQQSLTQAGASLTPQVGGVQAGQAVSEAGAIGAQLATTGAERVLGTASATKQAEFTQAGIATPRFFDKETGKVVDAAGNKIEQPVATKPVFGTGTQLLGKENPLTGGNPGAGGNAPGGTGVGSGSGAGQGGVGTGGNADAGPTAI
jgi:hypothetical protein